MFRNVGIYNSDARELPKRKRNMFRTRRKFEIKKCSICISISEIYGLFKAMVSSLCHVALSGLMVNNNNNNIYLLQLGCHPVAVVILHVHKT